MDTLGDECQGLYEVRLEVRNVQYRLLGFHGPGQGTGTLVFGARETDDHFVPANACDQAREIMDKVIADPNKHRRKHDYT